MTQYRKPKSIQLSIPTLTAGWHDKDQVLLHAAFQLLADFVEQESPGKHIDWSHDAVHRRAWKEISSLYQWWTRLRPRRRSPLDDKKIAKRTERWQKIALSAAKQCGRTQVPEILPLCEFRHMVEGAGASQLKLLFWEKETVGSLRQVHDANANATAILVAVGAEGGLSSAEVQLANARGFHSVHLGRRILRAETAAVAVLSLVQFLWGDLS